MQISKILVAAVGCAVAQAVQFTNNAGTFQEITAGQPFTFTWADASGPVTLTLKDGPATNLQTVATIQSGLSGASYVWNVPSTLPADTYAVEITDSTNTPNYSIQFQLIGGVTTTSSAASSTSTGSSSTGSSTSSGSTTSTGSSTTSTGSSTSTTSGSTTSTGSKTTSTSSTSTASKTSSATASAASTSAPSSASTFGVESPLALVFLALAAFFTLN